MTDRARSDRDDGLTSAGAKLETAKATARRLADAPADLCDLSELLATAPDDVDAVIGVLERNPGLASRVLAVVNRPAFGLSQCVVSISQAARLLGPRETRRVVLTQSLLTLADAWQIPSDLLRAWRRNGLWRACAARLIARRIDPASAEDAYLFGLIQDLGLMALAAIDTEFYRRIDPSLPPDAWLSAEREAFGLDHAAAGRSLLMRYETPRRVWRMVAHHHRPPAATNDNVAELAAHLLAPLPHFGSPDVRIIYQRINSQAQVTPLGASFDLAPLLGEALAEAENSVGQGQSSRSIDLLQRELLEAAAAETALAAAEHRQFTEEKQRLQAEAEHDALTGLLNRRGFKEAAHRLLRGDRPLSAAVLAMDLNMLKQVNDTQGHGAGDELIRRLARCLRETLSDRGVVARVGGDEFLAFLAPCTHAQAEELCAGLSDRFAGRTRWDRHGSDPLNVSLGAVQVDSLEGEGGLDDMIDYADRLMYQDKRGAAERPLLAGPDVAFIQRHITAREHATQ